MTIEKPYMPILVISMDEIALTQSVEQKKYHIAVEIDPDHKIVNKNLLQNLIAHDTPFLLLINSTTFETENIAPETVELINLCLFSKNYIRHNDFPVIAFGNLSDEHLETTSRYSQALISKLNKQGWACFIQWHLFLSLSFIDQVSRDTNLCLLIKHIDFDEDYLLHIFFSNPDRAGRHIFFKSTTLQRAQILEDSFARLCETALNRQPLFRTYLMSYLSAKNDASSIKIRNNVLEERLMNAETTIEIVRKKYKGDYDILFNWYQKEYESLPLWYKRLGHLIKAVTGKRTLKSLFNDEEKKKDYS